MLEIDLDEAVPPEEDEKESESGGGRWGHDRMHLIEIVSVLVLSIASFAAAWAGFQATRWNGEQAELYSHA